MANINTNEMITQRNFIYPPLIGEELNTSTDATLVYSNRCGIELLIIVVQKRLPL